jgi:hypothetical protein
MYRRFFLVILLLTLFLPVASAQSREETKFNEKQAKALHTYADSAFKDGFPQIARRVWLMLLSEYDSEHKKARRALGYMKVGTAWSLDPDFRYPKEDSPDSKAAARLQGKWAAVAKKVADAHKKMAQEYEKAGRTDKSKLHYEKVIFFRPDDEEAQAALNHQPVAGLTGTELEQTLYERSKKIERVVAVEARKDYEVEVLAEPIAQDLLVNAKIDYITVRSEHFTIHGDFGPELLVEAAKNAERAIRVCNVTFEGYEGFSTDPNRWIRTWAFFQDKDTYVQVLKANSSLIDDASRLKFLIENTRGSALSSDRTLAKALRFSAPQNEHGVYDGAVRNVAQAYSGFNTAAMREGIGHTIVGMFFNNNRQFIVDKESQQRSSTGEEDVDAFSPNMDTWGELALEAAWKLSEGTPAATLPLITADKFPDDARIKSWSFCDYVVRRNPELLLSLDRMVEHKSPIRVEEKFTEANDGLSIAQLEKEWKDFWTEASPVLKAIRNNTEPLSAVSKDVKKWLQAFNKARVELKSTEVTFSATYSGRCREHIEYLLAHEELRGADHEQMQDVELEGGSHLGDMFAQMALVSTTGQKPKDVFKRWLDYPGYRDALYNNYLRTIGLYSKEGILVMDAIRGIGRARDGRAGTRYYPSAGAKAIPTRIAVDELGPEFRAFLERNGHGDKTVVGYPISLHHFGIGGLQGQRESYRCKVTIHGKEVEGLIHLADGGSHRRTTAPGMVVFYPLEPLRKGVEIKVLWTYEDEQSTARKEYDFNT